MSSLGGSSSSGNFSRIAATVSSVSSTRQRGLREPRDLGRVAHDDVGDVVRALHELDVVGRLTGGALDLLVALVADEQDVVVVAGETLRLVVHLGHQRAGGVDRLQAPVGRLGVHRGRDTVRGEHHGLALGHLVELLDEDRAARLEVGHDVLVVDDLLAHVDRGAVQVERLLDGDDGAVDAGAVSARRREQHFARRVRVEDGRQAEVGRHAAESRCGAGDRRTLAAYGVGFVPMTAVYAVSDTHGYVDELRAALEGEG